MQFSEVNNAMAENIIVDKEEIKKEFLSKGTIL